MSMAALPINLESDFGVFEQHRANWFRDHPGEFVVIHKGQQAGFYPDYDAAFRAALRSFGPQSQFLIQQVYAVEPVFVIV